MSISEIYEIFQKCTGISTDTRTLQTNNLFIALSGDNFNGNKFAKQALEKGALYAIIDDENYQSENTILVKNTLKTLQDLATHHRRTLNTPIIALTGSNGKTTTKELINAVLSEKYNTTATAGNLNNHIGVPLTLLSMNTETEIGIVEMGANNFHEIELLSEITQPDYGYITNFGKAHLEGFGNLEGVVKAKSELYNHLRNNKKTAILNTDNKKQVSQSENIDTFTFSENDKSNTQINFIEANPFVHISYKNNVIKSNLIGQYNFTNIAAAITIGEYFNVDTKHICKAIENYHSSNNRSQIIYKGSNKIILDAYNANPTSMKAALENFNQIEASNKAIFIGDMFELGDSSKEEHQNIVDYIKTMTLTKCYILGKHFKNTEHPQHIKSYTDFKALESGSIDNFANYSILIKGSRGMALERILELL
jgi:UDP-N-acetylmuramoyl-tripeptide--D-alanyl-D-alanine ligase